jgi:hypothetical protein
MGIPLIEKRLTRDEVYVADEAFFTGTAAEVTPIRELDNRQIGTGARGPVILRPCPRPHQLPHRVADQGRVARAAAGGTDQ